MPAGLEPGNHQHASYKHVPSCIDGSITHLDSSIRMLLIRHQDITKSICRDQFPGDNFPRWITASMNPTLIVSLLEDNGSKESRFPGGYL